MTKIARFGKRFRSSVAGVSAVEFALVAPIFIVMLFGIYEFSRMMFVSSSVQHAVDRAARMVVIDPDVNAADIEAEIADILAVSGHPDISLTITTTTIGTKDVTQVIAHYDHLVSGPLIPEFVVGWDFETSIPLPD